MIEVEPVEGAPASQLERTHAVNVRRREAFDRLTQPRLEHAYRLASLLLCNEVGPAQAITDVDWVFLDWERNSGRTTLLATHDSGRTWTTLDIAPVAP